MQHRKQLNIREKELGTETITERHIVLVAPEVHWNTGNIGRTCLGANAALHLIEPLGFSLDSSQVRRAGLDYWHSVNLSVWSSFNDFLEGMNTKKEEMVFFAKAGKKDFRQLPGPDRLFLIFGSETKGLPEIITESYKEQIYHIPVSDRIRCLNLSTAVGIALYESLRKIPDWHSWG